MTSSKLLARGAEAELVLESSGRLIKRRVAKSYRVPALDAALRASRHRKEVRILEKLASQGVRVPKVLDEHERKAEIILEHVPGVPVKDILSSPSGVQWAHVIGVTLGQLHAAGVVHGDFTTSNMIASVADTSKDTLLLTIIDFGLSTFSQKIEDRAVDLHVLEETLNGTQPLQKEELWRAVCAGYHKGFGSEPGRADAVLSRLETVRSRGRNKMKG